MAWEEENEEEDYSPGISWVKVIPWIVVVALVIFGTGHFGTNTVDVAHMWAAGITLFALLVFWSDASLRMGSPQFIGNPIHTSINPSNIRTVGNWTLIRLGGFYKYGMHSPGQEGVAIMPNSAVNVRGRSIDGAVQFIKIPIEELPRDARATIEVFNYPKPYWFGLTDTVEFPNIPDLSFLETEIRLMNRQLANDEKLLKRDYESVEKALEHSKRIGEIYERRSWKDRFGRRREEE